MLQKFNSNGNLNLNDEGRYHIETSPLICRANQWTCFYMITASVIKGLMPMFNNMRHFGQFGTICKIQKSLKNTHGGMIHLVKLQTIVQSIKYC